MPCAHTTTKFVPTPDGPHYGKTICCDCNGFLRWEKQPATVEWENKWKARIEELKLSPVISEWEATFLKSISEQFPKLSPKQKDRLQQIYDTTEERSENLAILHECQDKPLTDWESDFVESLMDQFPMMSEKQKEILERIYNK